MIKIFDVEDGTLPFVLRGHRNLVHDLDFSLNDRFLLSASSDFCATMWKVPKNADEGFDEEESEKRSLLYEFKHPSYLYGAKIMPETLKTKRLIFATICFDGKVRVWLMEYRERDAYDRHGRVVVEGEIKNNNGFEGNLNIINDDF